MISEPLNPSRNVLCLFYALKDPNPRKMLANSVYTSHTDSSFLTTYLGGGQGDCCTAKESKKSSIKNVALFSSLLGLYMPD
jgi:hypothetical protein